LQSTQVRVTVIFTTSGAAAASGTITGIISTGTTIDKNDTFTVNGTVIAAATV
jgi:hypothetical protein